MKQPSHSNVLYWNILFYLNFFNLPCFFFQPARDLRVMRLACSTLHQYTFDEKPVKKSLMQTLSKTMSKTISKGEIKDSTSLSNDTSSYCHDKTANPHAFQTNSADASSIQRHSQAPPLSGFSKSTNSDL